MKQNLNYSMFNKYVLRTPILSAFDVDKLTVESIKKLCRLPHISEAIYIASPELHSEMLKMFKAPHKKDDNRLIHTLLKYLLRMGNRCTPFGLFSGCTIGQFSSENSVNLRYPEYHKRFTRLDMNYLCALAQNIENDVKNRSFLIYFKNTSLYKIGDKLRYIEYRYEKTFRRHFTVSIDFSDFLEYILIKATEGSSIKELAQVVTNLDSDIPNEAAVNFIHELIDNQILISSISPSITGDSYFDILERSIQNPELQHTLTEVSAILSKINGEPIGKGLSFYDNLTKTLDKLDTDYDKKYLLQTDLKISCVSNTINKANIKKINSAVAFLNRLNTHVDNEDLNKFKETFYQKYEDEEIPLALALDVESGVGYPTNEGGTFDISPLIDDLNMSSRNVSESSSYREIRWDKKDELLHTKLINLPKNKIEIELSDKDVESFEENWNHLPSTFSASINILECDEEQSLIHLNSVGGATASYLLGRFCHLDSKIESHVSDIIRHEETDGNELYAEILHLPEKRAGNILYRPHLRSYEIPYLAKSNLDLSKQIQIDDLMISVKNDEIVLRSKTHNKRVIPRMATAHNYSERSLPIYHFLCDMQFQNLKDFITFGWDNLYQFHNFFPRVTYKGVILSLATWPVKKETIKKLCSNKAYINTWRLENNIPTRVFLKEFDNKLAIDFEHDLSVDMFLESIKNKSQIVLTENLFNHNKALVKANGKPFTNEILLAFKKTKI